MDHYTLFQEYLQADGGGGEQGPGGGEDDFLPFPLAHTGEEDLGELGHAIVRDFFSKDGIDMGEHFQDCGLLLYDREKQDMHAGGSGCGCSASVFNGYLLSGMRV